MKISVMAMVAVVLALAFAAGCADMSPRGRSTATGAGIGAVSGGALGAIVGHNSGLGTEKGAIAGAVAGGVLGGVLGNQQGQINEAKQDAYAAQQAANTVTINVQNSNGSVTPVTLVRMGNQWQGPRGEFYSNLPTPDQLKQVYGF